MLTLWLDRFISPCQYEEESLLRGTEVTWDLPWQELTYVVDELDTVVLIVKTLSDMPCIYRRSSPYL